MTTATEREILNRGRRSRVTDWPMLHDCMFAQLLLDQPVPYGLTVLGLATALQHRMEEQS